METMGAVQFYLQWIARAFEYPLWVLAAISALLVLTKLVPDKFIPKSRPKMSKAIQLIRKYSIWLLLIFVLVGMIQAPYFMYKENQEEVKYLQELHRPYLILDTEIWENENTEEQIVNIDIAFLIENNGDRPAYNTRLRTCYASLRTLYAQLQDS